MLFCIFNYYKIEKKLTQYVCYMTLNFYLILRSKDLPERLDIQLTSVLELRQEMLDECHPGKHLTFDVFLIFILNALYVNSVA